MFWQDVLNWKSINNIRVNTFAFFWLRSYINTVYCLKNMFTILFPKHYKLSTEDIINLSSNISFYVSLLCQNLIINIILAFANIIFRTKENKNTRSNAFLTHACSWFTHNPIITDWSTLEGNESTNRILGNMILKKSWSLRYERTGVSFELQIPKKV